MVDFARAASDADSKNKTAHNVMNWEERGGRDIQTASRLSLYQLQILSIKKMRGYLQASSKLWSSLMFVLLHCVYGWVWMGLFPAFFLCYEKKLESQTCLKLNDNLKYIYPVSWYYFENVSLLVGRKLSENLYINIESWYCLKVFPTGTDCGINTVKSSLMI